MRADLDVSEGENYRLKALVPTIELLSQKGAKIILIGHRGRPEGKVVGDLIMKPIKERLEKIAGGIEFEILENLRFDPGEEANDAGYAEKLAQNGDFYVNEAFADSHRSHASIVTLPKLLPHAAGLRFVQEVENLSRVFENPKRPVIVIIGGTKKDKLAYIDAFKSIADKILVGGKLPEFTGDVKSVMLIGEDEQVVVGNLIMDKEDITIHTIERFESEIAKAGTVVFAGPMGKFEEDGHRQGTERVLKIIAKSDAYKVAGGGDTVAAIDLIGVKDKFDWISVGGGAMLEFLAKKTLPGIEALSY